MDKTENDFEAVALLLATDSQIYFTYSYVHTLTVGIKKSLRTVVVVRL